MWGGKRLDCHPTLGEFHFCYRLDPCEKHCVISRVVRARFREVTAKFQHWLQSLRFTGRRWRLAAYPLTIDIFLSLPGFLAGCVNRKKLTEISKESNHLASTRTHHGCRCRYFCLPGRVLGMPAENSVIRHLEIESDRAIIETKMNQLCTHGTVLNRFDLNSMLHSMSFNESKKKGKFPRRTTWHDLLST